MKILDRYIGKQVLVASLIGVFVLSFLLVFVNVFKKLLPRLVDDQVPASHLIEFMGLVLPFSLIFTIPWGFLTALLLVFGRLSANNEIVSMRMAGMSFKRICSVIFVIAAGFCLISYFINVSLAPRAEARIRNILYDLWTDDPIKIFEPDKTIDQIDGFRIYIEDRDEDILKGFQMVQLEERKKKGSDGKIKTSYTKRPVTILRAPEVKVSVSDDNETIFLNLRGQQAEIAEIAGEPGSILSGLVGVGNQSISLKEIKERAKQDRISSRLSSVLKQQLKDGVDPNEGTPMPDEMRSSIRTELAKRRSFSLACLTFAFLGIPLGITAQRKETSVGFVLGLAVAAIYFFLIILAEMVREDPGAKPHLLMWLPNVIFLGLGVFLFWRLSRK